MGTVSRYRVSAKIQQLLNTLKKPKRRPLNEFYEDDELVNIQTNYEFCMIFMLQFGCVFRQELELAARPRDPNAPAPEGGTMTPAKGPQLVRRWRRCHF